MNREEHHVHIRRRSRGLSWVLGPLFAVALTAWFVWSMVVCQARAEPWELLVCEHERWLPIAVGIAMLVNLAMLVLGLLGYSEDSRGIARPTLSSMRSLSAASSMWSHAASGTARGYRELETAHRDIVFRGLEASAWAVALTLGVLLYYWFEVSQLLGFIVIAFILRFIYGFLKWGHDRWSGGGPGAPPVDERTLTLEEALKEEFCVIHKETPKSLAVGGPDDGFNANMALNNLRKNTAAVCLSGGGIRSASFCLGVVQGLARKGLLGKFQYLSTVSGGGYTGSMLTAWGYRTPNGLDDVVDGLRNPATPRKPNPTAWLRQYCSYLAPRRGALSIDAWTIIVTYVRNLLLNSLILLPFLAAVVASPKFLAAAIDATAASASGLGKQHFAEFTLVAGLLALFLANLRLRIFSGKSDETDEYANKQWSIIITSLASIFALSITAGWIVEALGPSVDRTRWIAKALEWLDIGDLVRRPAHWALALGLAGLLIGAVYAWRFKTKVGRATLDDRLTILFAHTVAGLVLGAGMGAWEHMFTFDTHLIALAFVFGPPGLLLALAGAEAVFVGITSKLSDDYHREWLARLFGWLGRWSLIWISLGAIALSGPWLWDEIMKDVRFAIAYPAAVITVGAGLARFAFTQSVSGKITDEKMQSRLAKLRQLLFIVAAYLFIVLLLCLLSWLVEGVATSSLIDPWPPGGEIARKRYLGYSLDRIAVVFIVLVSVFTLASLFVNVNRFSLHSMYRDRLIRAFLGASREQYPDSSVKPIEPLDTDNREEKQFEARRPNLYTDFDRDDNPILWWMSRARTDRSMPFLVINGALNLVKSQNLAWQERKAASFTFSSLHVGSPLTSYAPTKEVAGEAGGITLGTALAISGAAVSPNAGYHSTPVLTFLLTLFNARLGWWLGNPRVTQTRREIAPKLALASIVNEMMGKTDAISPWIYVSDGGHFDNLGIYEMVRRGCRYIVAVDASADPTFNYDSLGIAIRKIRIDFGISIDLEGSLRIGQKTQGEAGANCAIFRIKYNERLGPDHEREKGLLLYIKSSHYPFGPDSPVDVRQYASGMTTFPHEPTTDQFFGESQFESYRALGEWELEKITASTAKPGTIGDLFNLAQAHVNFYQGERTKPGEPPASTQ